MYCGGDDIGAVVADIGSYYARIGFAGDDFPRAYFTSNIGITENQNGMDIDYNNNSKRQNDNINVHFDLSYVRENMAISNPLCDGLIKDWDLLEKIWEYSMESFLKVDIKETPILLAEKPYNSPTNRQKMCELMFEKYNVPAIFISKDSVLSCYACGRTTGLVVDVGASGTVICPVVDGWVETKGVNRSVIGGRIMDAHIAHLLSLQNVHLKPHLKFPLHKTPPSPSNSSINSTHTQVDTTRGKHLQAMVDSSYYSYMCMELARDLKENVCKVADSPLIENEQKYFNIPFTSYALPDGTIIDIGIDRFHTTELLFDSSQVDLSLYHHLSVLKLLPKSSIYSLPASPIGDPITKLILDSVLQSETDLQQQFIQNIILTGGGSSYENLGDRFKVELEKVIFQTMPTWKVKVLGSSANERGLCSWVGGSILASLGSFHEMWFSRAEYDEFGASLVDRKCP